MKYEDKCFEDHLLLPLGKRRAGLKSRSLTQCDEEDDSFLGGINITLRLLSRLCRLGIFMACISTGLKILTSRSCELASITELDLDLDQKDADFSKVTKNFLET